MLPFLWSPSLFSCYFQNCLSPYFFKVWFVSEILFGLNIILDLSSVCIWLSIFVSRFGKFSVTISLNKCYASFSLSSISETPIKKTLVHLMVYHKCHGLTQIFFYSACLNMMLTLSCHSIYSSGLELLYFLMISLCWTFHFTYIFIPDLIEWSVCVFCHSLSFLKQLFWIICQVPLDFLCRGLVREKSLCALCTCGGQVSLAIHAPQSPALLSLHVKKHSPPPVFTNL